MYGHDAFLKENRRLAPIFANVLNDTQELPNDEFADPGHPRRARGPRKLRRDRRRGAAAASVVHLCLSRLRRQAQVRLQPLGQSDARPAGRGAGGSRRRRGRGDHGFGHGRDHARGSPAARGRAHRRAARLLWRHVPAVHRLEQARRARRWISSTSAMRPRSTRRCRSRPRMVWIETPSNPLLRITDIADIARRAHADRRAGGRRQHLPVAGLAAAPRARRRHRGALDHQVHQRPQRRGRRRRDREDAGAGRAARLVGQLPGTHRLRVRQLSHAARTAHAARAAARTWPQCAGRRRIPRDSRST